MHIAASRRICSRSKCSSSSMSKYHVMTLTLHACWPACRCMPVWRHQSFIECMSLRREKALSTCIRSRTVAAMQDPILTLDWVVTPKTITLRIPVPEFGACSNKEACRCHNDCVMHSVPAYIVQLSLTPDVGQRRTGQLLRLLKSPHNSGEPCQMQAGQFCTGQSFRRSHGSANCCRAVCIAEMRVVAIPGALRKGSTNNGLLRAAAQVLPAGMHMEQADYSQLPLYNDDMWSTGIPESVKNFRNKIEAADALLFAVPEYNYSLPGPLKNAIDWASKNPNVFAGKPATMLGEQPAQLHWGGRACKLKCTSCSQSHQLAM